jgi:hypothetical protein
MKPIVIGQKKNGLQTAGRYLNLSVVSNVALTYVTPL